MEPLSKKNKTALLFVVWIALLAVAWFAAPPFLRIALKSTAYVSAIARPEKISQQDFDRARADIAELQKKAWKARLSGDINGFIDFSIQLGVRLEAAGQYAKAYQQYAHILARDPRNAAALWHKASVSEKLAVTSDALDAWRAAIESDPQNSSSYERLANVTERVLHDSQQANGIYVEGLVRGGNAVSLMRLYADFLERQGETHTALLYWKAITEKDPTDANAQNHLRALELSSGATL